MTITLGSNITIQTHTGPICGRVVGFENRDATRYGNGQTKPYVCVALPAPINEWRWFVADEVTR